MGCGQGVARIVCSDTCTGGHACARAGVGVGLSGCTLASRWAVVLVVLVLVLVLVLVVWSCWWCWWRRCWVGVQKLRWWWVRWRVRLDDPTLTHARA